jgi:26S proteasome regulatory subunit N5
MWLNIITRFGRTPSIKEDESGKGKTVTNNFILIFQACSRYGQALEHIVYYVVLSPHNNEQSDMIHHLFVDPALVKLDLH